MDVDVDDCAIDSGVEHCRHRQQQQQQQQYPVPVVDIGGHPPVSMSTPFRGGGGRGGSGGSDVIVRASLVVLFVVGVAFVVVSVAADRFPAAVADDVIIDGSVDDDGWLLPTPDHVIVVAASAPNRRQRRIVAAASGSTRPSRWKSAASNHRRRSRDEDEKTNEIAASTPQLPSSLRHVTVAEVRRILAGLSDCRRVDRAASNATYLASGWTKAVYVGEELLYGVDRHDEPAHVGRSSATNSSSRSLLWQQQQQQPGGPMRVRRRRVAVKVVDVGGRDVRQCVRRRQGTMTNDADDADSVTGAADVVSGRPSVMYRCQRLVERKLLKEAYVLRVLNNSHIVKVYIAAETAFVFLC